MSSVPGSFLAGIDVQNIIPKRPRTQDMEITSAKHATSSNAPPTSINPTPNLQLSTSPDPPIQKNANANLQKSSFSSRSNSTNTSITLDSAALSKLISDQIAQAFKAAKPNEHPTQNEQTTKNQHPSTSSISERSFKTDNYQLRETPCPEIKLFSGLTNVEHFIEDLESKFILQPLSHRTDKLKVMVAIAHLEGAIDNQTSNAPKEWARNLIPK